MGMFSVQDRVKGLLGYDDTVKHRASMLPLVRTQDDKVRFGYPAAVISALEALALPGHVAQGGSYTPRDVTSMALDVGMMGAPVGMAAAPRGALAMGAGGRNINFIDPEKIKKASWKSNSGKRVFEKQYVLPEDVPPELVKEIKKFGLIDPEKVQVGRSEYTRGYDAELLEKAAARIASREEKRAIKSFYEQNRDVVDNFHKNKEIEYEAIDINDLKNMNKIQVYKSPTRGGRQSSEYYLAMIDNEPAYIRKSNHWGRFGTNVTDVDTAVKHLGMTREEAMAAQMQDPFGRIGRKYQQWDLKGGARRADGEYANTSQAGFVRLKKK